MRALYVIVGLLQSTAAILIGLHLFNIDAMTYLTNANLAFLIKPLEVVFGLAGLLGLYFVLAGGSCKK